MPVGINVVDIEYVNDNVINESSDTNADTKATNEGLENVPNDNVEQAPRYNLKSARTQGSNFQFFTKEHRKHGVQRMMGEIGRKIFNVCFTQMQAKTGIKKQGQRAIAAMLKEYMQLTSMEVMVFFLKYEDLTAEQKKGALRAINLIKEKQNGILKGRTVADGRGHRGKVPKEKSASPSLHLDSFIILLIIDAFEGRDVGLFDVPGAFLQALFPYDKFIVLKFEGEFVDIMIECNPIFSSEVRMENGKKVLYIRLI